MRKLFLVLALFTSTVTHAENWQLIDDGVSGARLIVDVDSINVTEYAVDEKTRLQKFRAHANMQIITTDINSEVFTAVIDVDECVTKKAGILVNVFADGKPITYFWSARGQLLYDAQGQWLCAMVMTAINEIENKKTKPSTNKAKPKYTM